LPSSSTWRTSSTRPRRPAWTSITFTLLKSATAGRDFVRAYAYTGLDPDNENQLQFQSFLGRHDYKVVTKDIRKYGDGQGQGNLDIELVVDLMKTARNSTSRWWCRADGDFAPAIRAVQEMGVRVEVVSFRGNTSADLRRWPTSSHDSRRSQAWSAALPGAGGAFRGRGSLDDEVPHKETEGAEQRRRRARGAARAGALGCRDGRPRASAAEDAAVRGRRAVGRRGGASRSPRPGRWSCLPARSAPRAAPDAGGDGSGDSGRTIWR